MTYATLDESVQSGEPIYKFLFVIDETEYTYTSAPYIIGDSNRTWTPEAIRASSVAQNDDLARLSVQIDLPRDNALAQLFIGQSPEFDMTVTIFRGMATLSEDGSDDQTYWKGRVVSSAYEGDVVSLECENVFTSMSRAGLRAKYQRGCRHSLYSADCGVDKEYFARVVAADVVSSTVLDLTDLRDSQGDSNSPIDSTGFDNYLGGMIETAEGYFRYIVAYDGGSRITLLHPLPNDVLDSLDSTGSLSLTVYPGCAHNTADCKNVFNNLDNYGGFPNFPRKNPFGNSVTGSIA